MQEERYFIGQILWDPTILNKTIVTPSDFQGVQERAIYKAMLALSRKILWLTKTRLQRRVEYHSPKSDLKSSNIISSTWRHYQKVLIDASRVEPSRRLVNESLKVICPRML